MSASLSPSKISIEPTGVWRPSSSIAPPIFTFAPSAASQARCAGRFAEARFEALRLIDAGGDEQHRGTSVSVDAYATTPPKPRAAEGRESSARRREALASSSCGPAAFLELLAAAAGAGVVATELLRLAGDGPEVVAGRRGQAAAPAGFPGDRVAVHEAPFSAFRHAEPGKLAMRDRGAVLAVGCDEFDGPGVIPGPAPVGRKNPKAEPLQLRRPGLCARGVEGSRRTPARSSRRCRRCRRACRRHSARASALRRSAERRVPRRTDRSTGRKASLNRRGSAWRAR